MKLLTAFSDVAAAMAVNMVVVVVVVLGAVGVVGGCSILPSSGEPRLQSMQDGAILKASLPTRVYTSFDADTADMYMTDLPPKVWNSGADVSDLSGVLVHVHMFLRPRAGHTPIEDTASTAIVRCLVVSQGEIGVYGGGGFFVNSGEPGGSSFDGSVRNGTLRLVSATGGFTDRLGPSTFAGSISGKHDDKEARAMDRAMRALIGETRPIE